MNTTSGCLDAAGCGGPFSELGGGGGGGEDGGGDGVGEWSGVIGLGEVWLSGGSSSRGCEFRSGSPSVGAVAGRLAWGIGSVGAIMEDRCLITLASLSGFLLKVEVMVATIGDCAPYPDWCPPDMKIGALVEIF